MRRFSHWEYEDRRTFWGWRREYYPVYVEERDVYHMHFHVTVARKDTELERIEGETRRLRALKQQLDVEEAVLDGYLRVARKEAELQGLLQLTHRPQNKVEQKLLPYRPQLPMAKVR
jgi:hypothetical protein